MSPRARVHPGDGFTQFGNNPHQRDAMLIGSVLAGLSGVIFVFGPGGSGAG